MMKKKYLSSNSFHSKLILFSLLFIILFIVSCSKNTSELKINQNENAKAASCSTFSDCTTPAACNFDTQRCEEGYISKCFDTIDCKFAGTYCLLSDKMEYDEKLQLESYIGTCKNGCDEDEDCSTGKVCDLNNNKCQ